MYTYSSGKTQSTSGDLEGLHMHCDCIVLMVGCNRLIITLSGDDSTSDLITMTSNAPFDY